MLSKRQFLEVKNYLRHVPVAAYLKYTSVTVYGTVPEPKQAFAAMQDDVSISTAQTDDSYS
jgi:hypothetical protein